MSAGKLLKRSQLPNRLRSEIQVCLQANYFNAVSYPVATRGDAGTQLLRAVIQVCLQPNFNAISYPVATRGHSVWMFVYCTGNREQLNVLTAFVDGSNIYGSEQTEADDLRVHDGHLRGFLATSDGPIHAELPVSTAAGEGEAACNNDGDDSFPCRLAGDFRVNEQPGLASMHTLWVREHNRVARELLQNHGYQDDTVAMGHTWVNNHLLGEEAANSAGWELKENFFKPTHLHTEGSDIFIKNLSMETDVTENLFRSDKRNAFDLAALNIQRGRDHGVSYCATRKALGLKVPETFQEAESMQLFSKETIALLEAQKNAAGQVTLSTIICDNVLTDSDEIQPDAFLVAGPGNTKVKCADIPKLDLSIFAKEPGVQSQVGPPAGPPEGPPAPPAGPPEGAPPGTPRARDNGLSDNTADGATDEREVEGEIEHLLNLLAQLDTKENHEEE
ncbi:PXDN-like protein [Mya arenaria]|uniref:PXDN-like protein n=1 Tax=Mya arenaria TaxID=6604 RepID=A0ABY7EPG7_MYAAR|nr:PXDN-like protein [Mya arenaria]